MEKEPVKDSRHNMRMMYAQAMHDQKNEMAKEILTDIQKLESMMEKFGEAHNMLARTSLSKIEYNPISALLALAKIELFSYYRNLKKDVRVYPDK